MNRTAELRVLSTASVIVVASLNVPIATAEVEIHSLGPVNSGISDIRPFANSISADGTTIVGEYLDVLADERQAFMWTAAEGYLGLGDFTGADVYSRATAVSGDGNVVVGSGSTATGSAAFRWSIESGMIGLGETGIPDTPSHAAGISSDGHTVVGQRQSIASIWAFGSGDSAPVHQPIGIERSIAYAASSDGQVVVGMQYPAGQPTEAFRWSQDSGFVLLGDLPGGETVSYARDVSSTGNVVVGVGASELGLEAFRWTETDGMVGLGVLPGVLYESDALATNADGSIVIGWSESNHGSSPSNGRRAFIWDVEHGMRYLGEALIDDYGADLDGWIFREAVSVSPDGLHITGMGYDSSGEYQPFVVHIPEPTSVGIFLVLGLVCVCRREPSNRSST